MSQADALTKKQSESAGQKAAASEHCVFNIIIIFWSIIINKIGPNGQCSKIINFNRIEAGLTSKWGKISPAV